MTVNPDSISAVPAPVTGAAVTPEAIAEALLSKIVENPTRILALFDDPRVVAMILSKVSTAQYMLDKDYIRNVVHFPARDSMHLWLLKLPDLPPGLCFEFGVAAAESLRHFAFHAPERQWFGFDSFEGLPEAWHGHPAGTYTQHGKLPEVPSNVTLVPGWFDKSVPEFLKTHYAIVKDQGIAILHLDADIYSATKTVLNEMGRFLKNGSVIICDEFWGYPTWEHHEAKAIEEFVAVNPHITLKPLAYVPRSVQFAFRVEMKSEGG